MKEKPFLCNHCSFATNRKDRIKTHVMSVHSQHPEDFTHQPGNSELLNGNTHLTIGPSGVETVVVQN